MKRTRNVKILATLGPASFETDTIEELVRAGADLFRINMSHSSHEVMADLVARIRSVETKVQRQIGILVDLQGPKLRVGTFVDGEILLAPGQRFTLDTSAEPGTDKRVNLPHPEIFDSVKTGHRLLIDDGKVELICIDRNKSEIICQAKHGGKISNKKGVSLPDTLLSGGSLTPKDRADLDAALKEDIDWIALSFVQRPEDVVEVRKIAQGKAGILSKIEKPQAIDRLEEIIQLSDAIMIARGDLGVEMPLEQVPGLQKRMIREARRQGKPVVVATQMLESMTASPVPTRAEVSDVANAVFEGADAIMLSAESASGDYPVQAVQTMDRIATEVEADKNYRKIINAQQAEPEATGADAISAATRQIAETLDLAAIVTYTSSGSTGIRAARERPAKPIIALSPNVSTCRRLSIVWGLHCVRTQDADDLDTMVDRACSIAFTQGIARPGDRIIITAGIPFHTPGTTNMLRIAFVGQDGSGAS